MKIRPRYFSKIEKAFFIIANILLTALFLALFIIYVFFEKNFNKPTMKIIDLSGDLVIVIIAIFNATIILVHFFNKRRLLNTISIFYMRKDINGSLVYLVHTAKKKRTYAFNQRLLYYLFFFNLLKNSQDDALYYLHELNIKKQPRSNIDCLAYTIFFRYLIPYIKNDNISLEKEKEIYTTNKEKILKIRTNPIIKESIITYFTIIELLQNNSINAAITKIKDADLTFVPLIKDFIESKEPSENK